MISKQKLINSKIRIFTLQTSDPGLICKPDIIAGYLITLLVDKIKMNLSSIFLEVIYPLNKYSTYLLSNIINFQEDYFIFFLENNYHSSNYGLGFLKILLDKLHKEKINKKIIIHSFKLSQKKALDLMNNYNNIEVIIRTDSEYFFNEFLYKNTTLNNITNIIYKNDNNKIIINKTENINYDLKDYILGAYHNGYIISLTKNPENIIKLIDENNISNKQYKKDLIIKNDFLLATSRGCKYNCTYCYRGVKYSKIRLIPLDIIKKDLDYLSSIGAKTINLYDDCFLTSNIDRLEEIIDLLSKYDFYYRISVRYEMCNTKTFNLLKKIKLGMVQIGLQSTSKNTNKIIYRNIDKTNFKNTIFQFKKMGTLISIDIILGLPGETIKDFISTYNFTLALQPSRIAINTLFINPGISIDLEKYGIKLNTPTNYYNVAKIIETNDFSKRDIEKAKIYIRKTMTKFPFIKIILR